MGLAPSKDDHVAPSEAPAGRAPSSDDKKVFPRSASSDDKKDFPGSTSSVDKKAFPASTSSSVERAGSSSKSNTSKHSSEGDWTDRRSGERSSGRHSSRQGSDSSAITIAPPKDSAEGPITLPNDVVKDEELNTAVKAALLAFILLMCFGLTIFITHLEPASGVSPTAAQEVNVSMVVPDASVASREDDAILTPATNEAEGQNYGT